MSSCGTVRLVRGPAGGAGADGTDGTDGTAAWTMLTANFTIPAEQATADATVISAEWIPLGVIMYLQNGGYFEAIATPDVNTVTLRNVKLTASNAYMVNYPVGTIVPPGSRLTASGPQGPSGTAAASPAPLDATYITQTPNGTLTNEYALSAIPVGLLYHQGAGVLTNQEISNADLALPYVDETGGLDTGEALFATASGIESQSAATARTSLGLGTMAVQNSNNVTITGGTISGISGLGITDIAVFTNQQLTTVGGGSFNNGAWRTVPFNTEVTDPSGIIALAANEFTLAAGTYRAEWHVPAYLVNMFQTRLWNVSTAAFIGYGQCAQAGIDGGGGTSGTALSTGFARFTVTAGQIVRVEGLCQTTQATTGFGAPTSLGGPEIYGLIKFERE